MHEESSMPYSEELLLRIVLALYVLAVVGYPVRSRNVRSCETMRAAPG